MTELKLEDLKRENEFLRKEYINLMIKHSYVDEELKAKETRIEELLQANEELYRELKTVKQESAKSQKNPFGAGRKPKFTDDQVEQVKALSAEGLSVRRIAAKMDCSTGLVCKLLKN